MKMYYILGMICMMTACQPKSNKAHNETPQISVPVFSEDSAYQHVATQVSFGPRVPNTEAHRECADYLSAYLEKTGAEVIRQKAVVNAFDGTPLNMENIIGSFAPEKQRRILICAHWDSRPFADEESDAALQHTPIDGANDGASGVGVLLELARHIGNMPLKDARKHLMTLTGVGRKVADCILLFGYHRTEAFPVDTWIEKIYPKIGGEAGKSAVYIADKLSEQFGELAGYAQQYLFYYARENL